MKEIKQIFDVGDIVQHKTGIKHKIVSVLYIEDPLGYTNGTCKNLISYNIVPNIKNTNKGFFHQGSIYCKDCKLDIKEMRKEKLEKLNNKLKLANVEKDHEGSKGRRYYKMY